MNPFLYNLDNFDHIIAKLDYNGEDLYEIEQKEANNIDENDLKLNEIIYNKIDLSSYAKQLKGELFLTIEMKERLKIIITILKDSKLFDQNQPIIQLPNLCLTPFDERRFEFDDSICSLKLINRIETVDKYLNIITNKPILYIYGLKGIGKIIYYLSNGCKINANAGQISSNLYK
jgi:hypothetical protein